MNRLAASIILGLGALVTAGALYLSRSGTSRPAAGAPTTTLTTGHPATGGATKHSPHGTRAGPIGIPGAWKLTLDSEFNGTSLDTAIWRPGWFGSGITGPINRHERDCYSSRNVTLPGDRSVHLEVTDTQSTCNSVTKPYTGALLSSNPHDGRASGGFQYTYGALEARVYIPASGTQVADWPSVWTDGQTWPADGENDIVEGLAGQTCFNFRPPPSGSPGCTAVSYTGWHTFAADREPGLVTYYYDGVKVGQIATGVTAAPMYLILGIGVNAANPVVPAAMRVDYVRVWRH